VAPPDQGKERMWRFKLDDTTWLEVSRETPATKRVRPRGRFRILGALVVAMTLLTVVFTAGAGAEGTPSIASDKADYLPGEAVALSGSGWVAGEIVHVTVDDDQSDPWAHEADLTAADDGTFTGALTLPEVAGTYTIAASSPSGTAAATFTATPPPPLPPPPPSGNPAIASDKDDYAPGATVALSGSGWVVGEIVHVSVDDDQSDSWTHEADVTAADDGTLSDSFDLTELAGTFAVSATAPSGSADTSFTVTAQPPAPTTDPTLSSDKDAYSPGETVSLSGADWTAGGTVHVAVDDDKNDAWEHSANVTVAANGTITDTFDLPDGLAAEFTATATDPADRRATATFSAGFGSATEPYLVRFGSGTSTGTQAQILAAAGAVDTNYIAPLRIHGVLLPGGAGLQASLDKLRSYPSVTRVEPDRTREAGGTPNDSNYGDQWSLTKIGWENVFGTVSPSGSAKVAILDTGIDGSHPDLDGNVVPGTSILDGSNGLSDPNGHGTAMAGIVAAETDNGAGVAGIGYAGVTVMPVTVLGADGTGQDSEIIEGVVYAAEHNADVILMAFSNPGYSEMLQAAIDYAWESGAVLVAATGNDGSSSVTFPAGDRGVIGVSNTDQSDALNGSSNYGQAVFLGAPGTGIATTSAGGGYTSITGTSAAAAEVAGAAALISAASGASNGVIVSRLAKNGEPAGTQEQTGNGRLNVDRAIADESTDSIQPSGANPVGSGGPIVGPYVAATKQIDIPNVSAAEGNSLSTTMTFSLTTNGSGTGTVTYSTAPSGANPAAEGTGTCDPGEDYIDSTGALTFTQGGGGSEPKTINVTICGDTTFEPNETFTVSLTKVSEGNPGLNTTDTGIGTITNDDAPNNPPAGTNNTITITEDTSYTFAAADFGFTDPDAGDTMSAVRIDTLSIPAGATLQLSGVDVTVGQVISTANIPNLVFTPAPNANGAGYASFTFSVRDTNGPAFDPSPNTMTINVTAVDDPPVAVDDTATVTEGDPATTIDVLANDTDIDGGPKTVDSVTQPAHGTVVNNGIDVSYEPNLDYCNDGDPKDTFTYTLNGGSTATVSVTVACVNDPPVANDDSYNATEDTQLSVSAPGVLGNDTDVDAGDSLTVTAASPIDNVNHGSLTLNSNGSFTYDPAANYCGPDSFTYQAEDSANAESNTATVSITVACVNDPPVVTAGANQPGNEGASISVGATFTDVESGGTHTCNVSWGDSSSSSGTVVEPSGSTHGSCSASHMYADDNPTGTPSDVYSVTITVTDDGTTDGQPAPKNGSATLSVTVSNVAPTITSFTGTNSLMGPLVYVPSTFTTIFTDPGADTWKADFTWSDGSPLTQLVNLFVSGQTVTHAFATAGCNKIQKVRVTDDDGGFNEKTTTVNVGTGGFLPPMTNQPVTNKLKNGQVLPVKIQITDCTGASVNGLTPAIRLLAGDQTATFDDSEVAITPPSVSSADTNGYMRSSGSGVYIYNMSVNIPLNTDYTVIIYPYAVQSTGVLNTGLTFRHVIQATK